MHSVMPSPAFTIASAVDVTLPPHKRDRAEIPARCARRSSIKMLDEFTLQHDSRYGRQFFQRTSGSPRQRMIGRDYHRERRRTARPRRCPN